MPKKRVTARQVRWAVLILIALLWGVWAIVGWVTSSSESVAKPVQSRSALTKTVVGWQEIGQLQVSWPAQRVDELVAFYQRWGATLPATRACNAADRVDIDHTVVGTVVKICRPVVRRVAVGEADAH